MNAELTARTAALLHSAAGQAPGFRAIVGLDAFVDEIVRVVDKRTSISEFTAVDQIHELGARIVSAAGQSTNLELIVERVKLGGNGPIMANALAALGPQVTCVGPLGRPELHPAFQEIAARATVISLGQPAHTDALEFGDGKLMLGKLEPLNEVTWARMEEVIGKDTLRQMLVESDLVGLVNWTMVPAMSAIWEAILDLISRYPGKGIYFFDLADPEKHPAAKIAEACKLIAQFSSHRRTILGLNEKEAFLVGRALGYTGDHGGRDHVREVTEFVSGALPVETVVTHPRAYAVTASHGRITGDVDGPFVENPLISTGAGDHFNAGFCLGKLMGMDDPEAISAAVGTSGYYVRQAASPSLTQLAEFLASQARD